MSEQQHILVVEDEEHLAVGIKYNLEAEGYRVTTVSEGSAALKVIEEESEPVDLVILDLMLPGMSGYAICETLRSAGHHMPVLILSARTLPEDRTRGFEAGADQYMMKPFDLDEFISRVNNLLQRYAQGGRETASEAPEQYEFGEARIDFTTFQAVVGGETVRMTPLEAKLLRYFVAHAGRVIPRRELLEQVWEQPGGLNTRAPDQFLRRLRKIFEPDPSQPRHFLTIRDAGYRFLAETDPEEAE